MITSAIATDLYQLTMAQSYFFAGCGEDQAVFDYFFRKTPFGGGYSVFAGLDILLDILEDLRFTEEDRQYLEEQGFDHAFLEYLKTFRFTGTMYSSREGDLIFPTRPVLTVEAPIIEGQIIETILLNTLNFQTLIATKARRMCHAADTTPLIDFGMRRAHGPSAYYAARAACIGGFSATSNVEAGRDFSLPVSGTMAHSFIQNFQDEETAFRHYAETWPNSCILLVDTYDTLQTGVPAAIKIAREMENRGQALKGIRIDSGDLAYLSRKSRRMLDDAGFPSVKIAASNQLDEYLIRSLKEQKAPIDVFGVGTNLVTGQPDAAFDGVYKLAFSRGEPRIKLSENTEKITLPHRKQVHRLYDESNIPLGADLVSLREERDLHTMHHPFDIHKKIHFSDCRLEPLLHRVMENGLRCEPSHQVVDIADFSARRHETLPAEYQRFEYPHTYKVGLSTALYDERNELIRKHRRKSP
jgi:nicotinate phosphoribosyltransferase